MVTLKSLQYNPTLAEKSASKQWGHHTLPPIVRRDPTKATLCIAEALIPTTVEVTAIPLTR